MELLAKTKVFQITIVGLILGHSVSDPPPAKAFNLIPNTIIEDIKPEPVEVIEKSYLLEAMIQVESRGKEGCIGDKHLGKPSIGVLQIRPIMVREVNRILKKQDIKKKFQMDDRYSREKSIEMFNIWKDYYHSEDSEEVIARCWNGGPKGWKRKATEHYWEKVQNEIKILKS